MGFADPDLCPKRREAFSFPQVPTATFSAGNLDDQPQDNTPFDNDLIGLGGVYESLPPFEVMEELNRIFFERQQNQIPIIHPSRYLQAFYSAPHMKPPMCLQYAMWALAASGHPKYAAYPDIFYRRARQYADLDEMKGYGEHFITVAHAQAWCIIATYEDEVSPTLLPPKDWAELEERRRVFWGIFCIDSHCTISTGWPFLIDTSEVTTRLPAPESAFYSGEAVETFSIHDGFKGQAYSSFAGAIMVCHLFNEILKHVHKSKPDESPDNYEYGEFWQRHREIDNTLSSAFMCLPESFRLPENYRDQVAVHTNLNLHASVICLHHAAIDTIDTFKLPESAKKVSQDRLSTAAQEIVNIVKLTSHVNSNPKSPLAALSLYCAASVWVYMCKETRAPTHVDNLDFIIGVMEALGRDHAITRAFLRQVVVDIERNGIQDIARLPRLDGLGNEFKNQVSQNIPLLARSKISRHSKVQPPLPGLLPLGKPVGKVMNTDLHHNGCHYGTWTSETPQLMPLARDVRPVEVAGTHKRKRVSPSRATSTLDGSTEATDSPWPAPALHDRASTNPTTHSSPADPLTLVPPSGPGAGFGVTPQQVNTPLPLRTGSPHVNTTTPKVQGSSGSGRVGVSVMPTVLRSMGPEPLRTAGRGPDESQSRLGIGDWDLIGECVHSHLSANESATGPSVPRDDGGEGGAGGGGGGGGEAMTWGFADNEVLNVDWDALGASLGIDTGGGGGDASVSGAGGGGGGGGG
ncbi:hypothetical protein F4677DRAFT_443557 [Hypoxylon crocopeplum]|nr:hypothetical protein F4677DRAFT_443557 [Hypoxylon crocopeplum]